jgi:hypothetical protein
MVGLLMSFFSPSILNFSVTETVMNAEVREI